MSSIIQLNRFSIYHTHAVVFLKYKISKSSHYQLEVIIVIQRKESSDHDVFAFPIGFFPIGCPIDGDGFVGASGYLLDFFPILIFLDFDSSSSSFSVEVIVIKP